MSASQSGVTRSHERPSGRERFVVEERYLSPPARRNLYRLSAVLIAVGLVATGITAQVISRLYLGYHWISDTTGSIALSMVIVGTVIAIDTRRTVQVPGEAVTGEFSTVQQDGT